MARIDNNMAEIFDMEPVEQQVITRSGEVVIPETNKQSEKIDYDYDKSRSNLHNLLSQGQDALFHALEIAKSSEHPKAFEVVGILMKQLADINEQLLKLSERKSRLDTPKESNKQGEQTKSVTNNNAIFVGSTSELTKIIKNMNTGE